MGDQRQGAREPSSPPSNMPSEMGNRGGKNPGGDSIPPNPTAQIPLLEMNGRRQKQGGHNMVLAPRVT